MLNKKIAITFISVGTLSNSCHIDESSYYGKNDILTSPTKKSAPQIGSQVSPTKLIKKSLQNRQKTIVEYFKDLDKRSSEIFSHNINTSKDRSIEILLCDMLDQYNSEIIEQVAKLIPTNHKNEISRILISLGDLDASNKVFSSTSLTLGYLVFLSNFHNPHHSITKIFNRNHIVEIAFKPESNSEKIKNFLKVISKLTYHVCDLKINTVMTPGILSQFAEYTSHPSIKSLKITVPIENLNSSLESLYKLHKLFPSLSYLHIYLVSNIKDTTDNKVKEEVNNSLTAAIDKFSNFISLLCIKIYCEDKLLECHNFSIK